MLPHLFDAEMIALRTGCLPSYKKGNGSSRCLFA